jgi:phosphate-selective porin OprO/OprP
MSSFHARAALAALAAFAATAQAQTGSSATDVDQRLRVLERKLEIQEEEAAARAKDAPVVTANEKGFTFKSADGSFELALRGLVQADARFFTGDLAGQGFNDTFLFRRVEPSFQGSVGKLVSFVITPQFAESNSAPNSTLLDAWLDLKFSPYATVRLGKFKEPVGLETLQSSSSLSFIERGLPNELAPGRDLGLQLSGKVADGVFQYAAGVFNGTPDGRDVQPSDGDNRKEYAARLFTEPFKQSPGFFQGLGFGIGSSHGIKLGTGNNVLPRYRSTGQNQVFTYAPAQPAGTVATVSSIGAQDRIAPQLFFYRNSFSFIGEWTRSSQELLATAAVTSGTPPVTATTKTEAKLTNKAWQVVSGYVLTGEDASYRGVKPKQPFTLGADGWGALELLGRYGVLDIDDDAFPVFADPAAQIAKEREWAVGLNWYLTQNFKLVADYDQTRFDGGAKGTTVGVADRPDETAVFLRAQVNY